MMLEQRGRHFDPVLLDTFLEVLASSGPTRARVAPDPKRFSRAPWRPTPGARARRRRDRRGSDRPGDRGRDPPATLHSEVIAPALRQASMSSGAGGDITSRPSTLRRGSRDGSSRPSTLHARRHRPPARARPARRDRRRPSTSTLLGLQMVHDQLAAAGYQTTLDAELSPRGCSPRSTTRHPDLVVIGATAAATPAVDQRVEELRESHPDIPIVLGGAAEAAASAPARGCACSSASIRRARRRRAPRQAAVAVRRSQMRTRRVRRSAPAHVLG